jgi:tetratricopeptide (TPR) repeat protein
MTGNSMFKNFGILLFLFLITPVLARAAASSQAYYEAGNKLYAQGKYELCVKYYKAAIQVDPQNWKAYQTLGNCEYHQQKVDDALRDFKQSLAINPNNPALQNFVNKILSSPAVPPPPSPGTTVVYSHHKPRHYGLPEEGSITWNLRANVDLDSYDDFANYYGGLRTAGKSPIGGELGVGGDYTIAPEFQLGLSVEAIVKITDPVDTSSTYYGITGSELWTEIGWGPALDVKYLIPLDHHYTFMIQGETGFYSLAGSIDGSISSSYVSGSYLYNLSGSSIGGLVGVQFEWLKNAGLGVDVGIGYRFLSFSSIHYTYTDTTGYSTKGTLKNANNGNAYIDFSGFTFTTAIRFF